MSKPNKKYDLVENSFPPQMPERDFEGPSVNEMAAAANKQLADFSELLDRLSSVEEKKKALWKHIYENAVTDRRNAYTMFADLYKNVHGQPAQHSINGMILAKYLERMEKANQQIIKLAELVDKHASEEEDAIIDEDDMYDKINQNKKS